jgi:hypothetical protein
MQGGRRSKERTGRSRLRDKNVIFTVNFNILNYKSTSYLVISSILTYLSYDVSTTFRTMYEIPITISTYMPIQTEYSVEFLRKANRVASNGHYCLVGVHWWKFGFVFGREPMQSMRTYSSLD